MLTVPLPFVATVLLLLMVVVLRIKSPHHWKKPISFIVLCMVTMTVVGLRWTIDYPFLRALQPILGACLPVTAWLIFSRAHQKKKTLALLHWTGPLIVTLCSFSYPYLSPNLIDYLVPLLSLWYGSTLIKSSFTLAEEVPLSQINRVSIAERITGLLLLLSALTDSAVAYDFIAFAGTHVRFILSVSYLLLIPSIAMMVIMVSICTPIQLGELAPEKTSLEQAANQPSPPTLSHTKNSLNHDEIFSISAQFAHLMTEHELFKEADLTLSKIARKLGIPARKISFAINQQHGENISKVINTYRIDYAKHLLTDSDMTITDIFLHSGFQTKSNFHREFSRITGQTPTEYRQTHCANKATPLTSTD